MTSKGLGWAPGAARNAEAFAATTLWEPPEDQACMAFLIAAEPRGTRGTLSYLPQPETAKHESRGFFEVETASSHSPNPTSLQTPAKTLRCLERSPQASNPDSSPSQPDTNPHCTQPRPFRNKDYQQDKLASTSPKALTSPLITVPDLHSRCPEQPEPVGVLSKGL